MAYTVWSHLKKIIIFAMCIVKIKQQGQSILTPPCTFVVSHEAINLSKISPFLRSKVYWKEFILIVNVVIWLCCYLHFHNFCKFILYLLTGNGQSGCRTEDEYKISTLKEQRY